MSIVCEGTCGCKINSFLRVQNCQRGLPNFDHFGGTHPSTHKYYGAFVGEMPRIIITTQLLRWRKWRSHVEEPRRVVLLRLPRIGKLICQHALLSIIVCFQFMTLIVFTRDEFAEYWEVSFFGLSVKARYFRTETNQLSVSGWRTLRERFAFGGSF